MRYTFTVSVKEIALAALLFIGAIVGGLLYQHLSAYEETDKANLEQLRSRVDSNQADVAKIQAEIAKLQAKVDSNQADLEQTEQNVAHIIQALRGGDRQ